jgi:molybdopterin synthase sulfur carrier subunit
MNTGRIEIRLYASLQNRKSNPVASRELTGAKTVRELLLDIDIPEQEVAVIMINGKRRQLETTLSDGDEVSLFPLMGGG